MMHPKRVLIVDDHRMVRAGLKFALQLFPDLQVVGEASSGAEALSMTLLVEPDVVLMNLTMPDNDCITTTGALMRLSPTIKVLAVAGTYSTHRMMMDALNAGAVGCVDRYLSIDELAWAILAA